MVVGKGGQGVLLLLHANTTHSFYLKSVISHFPPIHPTIIVSFHTK